MNKKKIVFDFALNIVATLICSAILNFVLYPKFASYYNEVEYGCVLTIYGIINIGFSSFGNVLCNIRLIANKQYPLESSQGNFNIFILFLSFIGSSIVALISLFSFNLGKTTFFLIAMTTLIGIARTYFIVSFRINLDFKKQLLSNTLLSLGYVLGIFIAKDYTLWPLPFFFGEIASFFFVVLTCKTIKEPFKRTKLFKFILSNFLILFASSLIGNTLVYLDRFLIYPLLGAENVTAFSVASFWGKCLGPFIAPLASVILSYLVQKNVSIDNKKYIIMFILSYVPVAIMIVSGFFLAPFFTKFFYPTKYDLASKYIFVSLICVLLGYATDLITPIILSQSKTKNVLILQVSYFILYFISAFLGAKYNGLYGFCVFVSIANIIKGVLYFVFGFVSIKNTQKQNNLDANGFSKGGNK